MSQKTCLFPEKIDSRLFLSEVKLSQVSAMKEFRTQIGNSEFTKAVNTLKTNEISFVGADVMTKIEDEVIELEKYIESLQEEAHKYHFDYYMPEDFGEYEPWISDLKKIEETPARLTSASDLHAGDETGLIE